MFRSAPQSGPVRRAAAFPLLLLLFLPLFTPASSGAQEPELDRVLSRPEVQSGLRQIENQRDRTAAFLREIGGIVSPSGEEHERAEAVARRMREVGLQDVRVTSSPNAVGVIPGESDRVLVFISTLDDLATVAEHQRAAEEGPRIEGDRVVGPGTNTSLTTAALLAAAEAFVESGLRPRLTLVFAAVAQEETGLVGMHDIYAEYRDRAEGFVDVLGDGHSISYGAIGIHWWRVVASGPGGHTLSGGLPNVNQGIARAVDRILSVPGAGRQDDTRTRINVAILESGTVYNHKPASGWFSLDIRSMDAGIIEAIETRVRGILDEVSEETEIGLVMEPFQLTPGGQIPGAENSTLVRTATEVSRYLGYEPSLSRSGSSNMNVAVAGGTLAIGLGGSRGGERGRPGEWADIDGMMRTAKHVFLLAAAVTTSGSPEPGRVRCYGGVQHPDAGVPGALPSGAAVAVRGVPEGGAPHKPLLLLLALAEVQRGGARTVGGPTVGGKDKDGVSDLEVARRYVEVRLGSSGRLLGFPGRTGKES